jgi:folate-binding protein YgfZ
MNTGLYKSINLHGSDVEEFLQGQLTQDVTRLADTASLPAAWCNPKGRVITTVRLLRRDASVDLVLPSSNLDPVLKRLAMYRLRADVTMDAMGDDWAAVAFRDADSLDLLDRLHLKPAAELNACCAGDGFVTVSPGLADCVEVFGERARIESAGLDLSLALGDADWQAARIEAALPDIGQENSEKYTPHMLNLDLSGAVSFNKGCYTGQEVVARTENLGSSKRRLMRYEVGGASIGIGDPVSDGERDVGSVVNVAGERLLAVTPGAMHERALSVHGSTISPIGLPYPLSRMRGNNH